MGKSGCLVSVIRHFSNERQHDDDFELATAAAVLSSTDNYASEGEKP
jgi:hypothetical protein